MTDTNPTPPAIARAALLGAIALAPVAFWPGASDIFGLPKLVVIMLGVAVALVAAAVGGLVTSVPRPAASAPVLAMVAAVALATVFSISPRLSLLGSYERYGGLLPMLVHVTAAALVVVVSWRDPGRLRDVAGAILAGGAVVAGYVLVQRAGLDPLSWEEKSGAPVRYQAGTMGNSNFAGGYLGATLPLLWPRWREATTVRAKAAIIGVAIVYAVGLLGSEARGGLLALAIGSGVLSLVLWRGGRRQRRDIMRFVAGGAAVVVLLAVLVATPEVLRTESLRVRQREWSGAVEVFLSRPIVGSGPDTFGLLYPSVRSEEDGRALGLQIADKPHNLLLEQASGTGILGLLAFLYLVVSVLRWAIRDVRSRPVAQAAVPASFLAVLAGYLAQSLFSFEVPPLALLFWVVIGALVVSSDPRLIAARAVRPGTKRDGRRAKTKAPAGAPGARWSVVAGAVLVALVVVAVGLRWLAADLAAGASLRADGAGARDRLADATRLHPSQPAYWLMAGAAAERDGAESEGLTRRRALLADAVDHYRRAHELEPRLVLAVVGLARSMTLAGQGVDPAAFPEAERWWREAIRLDPNDWEVHEGYGLMLNSWANAGAPGRRAAAAEALQRSLEIRPDRGRVWGSLALILEAESDPIGARRAARQAVRHEPDDPELRALADRLT